MKESKHSKAGLDQVIHEPSQNLDILYVLNGSIEVKEQDGPFSQTFGKNGCYFSTQDPSKWFGVKSTSAETSLFVISRKTYDTLQNNHTNQQTALHLKSLHRLCPLFKDTTSLLDIFESKVYEKNTVISTPTSGVLRLTLIV